MSYSRYVNAFHTGFSGYPRPVRYAAITILTALIATLDLCTPPYVFMLGFYFLPIFLAFWYGECAFGLLIAFVSVSTSLYMTYQDIPASAALWQSAFAYSSIVIAFGAFSALIRYLRSMFERLQEESQTDSLTGLRSRRHFFAAAQYEISRAARSGSALTLAVIDLDNFKHVNDTQGHAAGDALLVAVSRCMTSTLREVDLIGRIGGDEFTILLPGTDIAQATEALERLRSSLRTLLRSFSYRGSASIGAVTMPPGAATNVDNIIGQADALMYKVKHSSKDAVAIGPFISPE